MKLGKQKRISAAVLVLAAAMMAVSGSQHPAAAEHIGVLYGLHGGMDEFMPQNLWDAGVQQFVYDPNHPVFQLVVWGGIGWWPSVAQSEFAVKFTRKFEFEYERIGGVDPFHALSDQQLADMKAVLDSNTDGHTFEVDFASWMSGDRPGNLAYPRFLYYGPPGNTTVCNYCGEGEPDGVVLEFQNGSDAFGIGDTLTGQSSGATAVIETVTVGAGSWAGGTASGNMGLSSVSGSFADAENITGTAAGVAMAFGTTHWEGCDPDRFDVDGPVERLLAKGVTKIIMIDMVVGGVRFFKGFEIYELAKKALDDWNQAHGTNIPMVWANDPADLMERTYPTAPAGWTPILGPPDTDPSVPISTCPNPVAADMDYALLHVEGLEGAMNPAVADADTGVMLFNHGLFDPDRRFYDPKINDTITLQENIKAVMLARHPAMDPDNIVGGYGGIKEVNPENGIYERTRNMRGESLAYCNLLESDVDMPAGEWGYRYWEALEYLKNRGVQHIVIGFPQVITDSVLTMIEVYNQIGNTIGTKSWLQWGTWNYSWYPGVGHPFADYWGNWVDTDCGGEPCCLVMGGCGDSRPYPAPRQTPLNVALEDMDPSLAFDLSDYGHLGYDEALGPPSPFGPVQDQYTGTWEQYIPPNADPRMGAVLAKHVLAMANIDPTLVELSEFRAAPGSREVRLFWTTAAEVDNAGFNLYRSGSEGGPYVKINAALIAAKGSPVSGASYTFVDAGVQNRRTYYYRLEDVETGGQTTMNGPVSATPRLVHELR